MRRKNIRSFVILSVLFILFFTPILGTWFVLTNKNKLANLHFGLSTQRFFLDPIIPIASVPIITVKRSPFNTEQLHGKWTLLYFNTESCSQYDCSSRLTNMLQIHQSLGKDQNRLIRMWISSSAIAGSFSSNGDKKLRITQIDKAEVLKPNHFYIIDPLGNLILSYRNNASPQSILNDLQHLMRISQIG